MLKSLGGTIVGFVKHTIDATDFFSYLVRGISSGATTVALISAGTDTVNGAKQASEFGIGKGTNTQHLAAPIFYLTSAHEIGAEGLQGRQYLTAFYWDRDDASRALGRRFAAKRNGVYPNHAQMENCSAGLHYLRAIQATGSRDGLTVLCHMNANPVNDPFAQGYGCARTGG